MKKFALIAGLMILSFCASAATDQNAAANGQSLCAATAAHAADRSVASAPVRYPLNDVKVGDISLAWLTDDKCSRCEKCEKDCQKQSNPTACYQKNCKDLCKGCASSPE